MSQNRGASSKVAIAAGAICTAVAIAFCLNALRPRGGGSTAGSGLGGVGSGDGGFGTRPADRPMVFNRICVSCHSIGGIGGVVGPPLDRVGDRLTDDYIRRWLVDPYSIKPDSSMPKLPLTEAEIDELGRFLSRLKAEDVR